MKPRGGSLTRLAAGGAFACLAAVLGIAPAAAAETKTSKPLVSTTAWYWEQAQAKDFEGPNGTVTVDTNNENCPQVPGGGLGNLSEETCAEGRLPVRIVAGDYEKPNQLSAVMFDTLTSIPIGSKVQEFTATFEEAKAGCRDKDTAASGKQCEASQPVNVEGHELQACLVTEIFGEGAARPYRELPKHECSNSDPTATRKKDGDKFTWTFDLTSFAQQWADGDVAASGIVITGAEPKNSGPNDTWRVTLLGAADDGIKTLAKYVPPDDELAPLDPLGPTDLGIPGTPGTPAIPGTPGTPGIPAVDTGTTDVAPVDDAAGGAAAEPGEATAPVEATDETLASKPTAADSGPPGGGLPWYGWLALLGGMAGFSALRSTVLDGAAGIRPDGVLAQIQRLNAQRRGGAAAAGLTQPGLWTGFLALTAGLTSGVAGAAKKVSGSKVWAKSGNLIEKLKRIPGKRS